MKLYRLYLSIAMLCSFCFSQITGLPGEQYPWAAQSGAYCWYQDPRAIYHKGTREKTFIGFIDNAGTVKVWSYDHVSDKTASSTLHTAFEKDDHDSPSLFWRPDGRITAYYTRHGTDRYIFHRTTTNPEDISTWQTESSIVTPQTNNGTCYTHEFQLKNENNRIYLFTRNLGYSPTLLHSDDDGMTWSKPRQVVTSADRPYTKYVSDGESRVHFAFTDGHPRDQPKNSIYYMYMEQGKFYKASGALIKDTSTLPVKTGSAYEGDRIYNGSTRGKAWIWDIALDSQKRPVMVFAVFPNNNNHHYYYARWNGTQWFMKDMVNAGKWFPQTSSGTTEREPNYSPGISLDHSDPSIVYLSRFINNQCEIERWTTTDGGDTWTSIAITKGSAKRNVRPIVAWPQPHGAKPPAKKILFWMNGDYNHYTNYSTGIKYCILTDQTVCSPRIIPPIRPSRTVASAVEIFSITGKRMRKIEANQTQRAINSLPSGIFLVGNDRTVHRTVARICTFQEISHRGLH
ncbi:MAG: BNR-4 repeat-containing protein [Chitinispirillaceae bacterium]|nr:BNR-4 repeat-containing protein [Chitinispirillaceae bacterium]